MAGLAHTRLSIIDTSPAGHQPMASADEAVWISYNGEAYNFTEIRRELDARGYRFRSDTEVIVNGWHAWGPKSSPGCAACSPRHLGPAIAATDSGARSDREKAVVYAHCNCLPVLLGNKGCARLAFSTRQQRFEDALGELGSRARRSGRSVVLRSTDLAPNSNEPSPIELPPSWSLTVEPPIAFRYDGVCTGGKVRLSFPAGERSYRLQPPYCRPEAM